MKLADAIGSHAIGSRSHDSFRAAWFGAAVGYVITLAIVADNEHWSAVAVTIRLVGGQRRRISALRRNVADAFSEAAVAEFISATKKFDRVVRIIGSERGLHGAEVLIT